jgi:hypothetical protein
MSSTDQDAGLARPTDDTGPAQHLVGGWQRALAGDPQARAQWQTDQGGQWVWQRDGLLVKPTGAEWSSFGWSEYRPAALKELGNVAIELTVSGKAEAAGLSFGHFKDFLARLGPGTDRRHLQLEVDLAAGCWTFRVDGQLQDRCWWDAALQGTDDLVNGRLALKARGAEQVLFQDLTLHTFQASCRLSVVLTCYRFLQRMRVALRNWCHQTLPFGAYEVLVVNPGSPDGTHEHLAAVARSYPHVRIREVPVEPSLVMNKGAMINCGVRASRGEWVWLTDADCLFSPACAAAVLDRIRGQGPRLFYGRRLHLTACQTDALLAGRLDGVRDFEALCRSTSPKPPDDAPWGYTQIMHRSILELVPYPEDFNHFAHSDGMFAADCQRHGIQPEQIDGLFCLHLDHPFAWYGTNVFL